jgi:hypothetical protein
VITIADERVFPLGDMPDHVPHGRGGKRRHPSTGFRWAKHGHRGIRLETIRIGGTLCTSVEALQRFFERLSATDGPAPASSTPARRSPACRAKDIATADAELKKLGV